MLMRPLKAEFREDPVDDLLVVPEKIIGRLVLPVCLRIFDHVALEGRHFVLPEERRILIAPDPPQNVLPLFPVDRVSGEKCPPHQRIQPVIERPPFIDLSVEIDFLEISVRCERHAAVEEQISVIDRVELAFPQKELHVLLQPLAAHEGALKALHDIFLLRTQRVRILRIDGREIGVPKRISPPVQLDRPGIVIDLLQEIAVHHVVFRPSLHDLAFDLELDDGDCLVDADIHLPLLPGQLSLGLEACARVISVGLLGKCRQRKQVDPVPFLQNIQISVARADPYDVGDAAQLSAGRAHPLDVMVPPLNVQTVVVHKGIHDIIRSVAPVINIPENMEMVHDQAPGQLREGLDEALRPADPDNRIDDLLVIRLFILNIAALRDQLVDHVRIILRHGFSHLGPRILAGSIFADLDQPVQHDPVPVIHLRGVGDLLFHQVDLLGRIVHERRELTDILFRQRPPVDFIYFFPHGAGAVSQNVGKGFILSVNIRDKMLRPLRKVQDRAQIDDLRRRIRDGRIEL